MLSIYVKLRVREKNAFSRKTSNNTVPFLQKISQEKPNSFCFRADCREMKMIRTLQKQQIFFMVPRALALTLPIFSQKLSGILTFTRKFTKIS
jgi:hypothetical protein